jgi:hypothetical protein
LSETLRFSPDEIRGWLESQTSAILTPVHTQAQRLRDELNLAIRGIEEVSKSLLDNSAKEIEKRNMRVYNRARALNKLARLFLDRFKKLNAPDQVTYENLNKFAQDAQKVFFVTDIDIKNWFPRLSPFFIMDRRKFLSVHEKAKQSLTTLNEFLANEYIKTKTLEETFQLINDLNDLETHLIEIEAERTDLQKERVPIDKEIKEIEKKVSQLHSDGPVDELQTVESEKNKLNKELKHSLRHLQKPFKKVQALSLYGGGAGFTPDEVNKLNQYLEDPFGALSTEDIGYPLLKHILEKLTNLMEEEKLKLKPDKARKAEQIINEILKRDALSKIHIRCVGVALRRKQLLNSKKMEEVKLNLSSFEGQIEQLKTRKSSIEAHESIKERAYNETKDKIDSTKKTIERNILDSLNQKTRIL